MAVDKNIMAQFDMLQIVHVRYCVARESKESRGEEHIIKIL